MPLLMSTVIENRITPPTYIDLLRQHYMSFTAIPQPAHASENDFLCY